MVAVVACGTLMLTVLRAPDILARHDEGRKYFKMTIMTSGPDTSQAESGKKPSTPVALEPPDTHHVC
jgi:cytochrome c-type biogenesis protein CcmE